MRNRASLGHDCFSINEFELFGMVSTAYVMIVIRKVYLGEKGRAC